MAVLVREKNTVENEYYTQTVNHALTGETEPEIVPAYRRTEHWREINKYAGMCGEPMSVLRMQQGYQGTQYADWYLLSELKYEDNGYNFASNGIQFLGKEHCRYIAIPADHIIPVGEGGFSFRRMREWSDVPFSFSPYENAKYTCCCDDVSVIVPAERNGTVSEDAYFIITQN